MLFIKLIESKTSLNIRIKKVDTFETFMILSDFVAFEELRLKEII